MATPFTVVELDVVGSTQDEARQRFAGEPVLVVAAAQTAGRGRAGAMWEPAPRAVAASLAWQPGWPVGAVARLTLVAGLAALDVIGDAAALKWPNDLMIGERKVGGILTERFDAVVVTGLGLNLFWPDPPAGIGAVGDRDPGAAAAAAAGRTWGRRMLERTAAGPEQWGWVEYGARCLTVGRDITWDPDGNGTAVGIAREGGLIVDTARGRVVLESGAVRSVRSRGGERGRR